MFASFDHFNKWVSEKSRILICKTHSLFLNIIIQWCRVEFSDVRLRHVNRAVSHDYHRKLNQARQRLSLIEVDFLVFLFILTNTLCMISITTYQHRSQHLRSLCTCDVRIRLRTLGALVFFQVPELTLGVYYLMWNLGSYLQNCGLNGVQQAYDD